MFCRKCGSKLEENYMFCPKCGLEINLNSNIVKSEEELKKIKEKENQEANKYAIIFIISMILPFVFPPIGAIATLIAMISIVTGFLKCPNSKLIKILFWLFIVYVTIFVIVLILIILSCGYAIANFDCYSFPG